MNENGTKQGGGKEEPSRSFYPYQYIFIYVVEGTLYSYKVCWFSVSDPVISLS